MLKDILKAFKSPPVTNKSRKTIMEERAKGIAKLNSQPSPPLPGEEPILAELHAAGYDVESIDDLRRSGIRYRNAIPILLAGLPLIDNPQLGETIVRALTVPWAKPAAAVPLIELFRNDHSISGSEGWSFRWVIGNALELVGDDWVFDDLVALARDRGYGRAREMIVLGLRKSKRPEAADILIRLSDDPDVYGHAVAALAKMKAPAAREVFEAKLHDERAWIRKEARKGLERLDRLTA